MAAIRDTQLYTTWRRKAQGGLLAAPRGKGDVDDEGRGVCGLLGSVDVVEQATTPLPYHQCPTTTPLSSPSALQVLPPTMPCVMVRRRL